MQCTHTTPYCYETDRLQLGIGGDREGEGEGDGRYQCGCLGAATLRAIVSVQTYPLT